MTMDKSGIMLAASDTTIGHLIDESDKPVLVDFWAEWCPTCKALTPVLEELAATYAGRVTFAAIDADANPNAASTHGVSSLPSMLIFVNGELVKRLVGPTTKAALIRELEAVRQA